jgi:hypothetical protein
MLSKITVGERFLVLGNLQITSNEDKSFKWGHIEKYQKVQIMTIL